MVDVAQHAAHLGDGRRCALLSTQSDNIGCCHPAGAQLEGADTAVLLRATWRDTRRAVLKAGGVTEFAFRQYLFACQGRVLLRMRRPQEVAFSVLCKTISLCFKLQRSPSGLCCSLWH